MNIEKRQQLDKNLATSGRREEEQLGLTRDLQQEADKLDSSTGQQTSGHCSIEASSSATTGERRGLIDKWCCSCCRSKNTQSAPPKAMSSSTRFVWACFLAELLGTFLLVLIGDGAIASYVVMKREVDMFAACLAFGVGAMIATFASAKISGAHINPAASVAFALDGQLKWRLVPIYLCAQYLGGFLAALVLMVNYGEAINSIDGGAHLAFGSQNATGHIFATYPGAWVSPLGSLLDQIIGTAVLLFSISAVGDRRNLALEARFQPIVVALVIGLTCVAFSANCGAIFNPARDLAPRLLTFAFGYANVWTPLSGLYWLLAGVLGPHLGAVVGVFGYKLLIGRSLEHKQVYELELAERDKEQHQQLAKYALNATRGQQQQQHQVQAKHELSNMTEQNYGSSIHSR